MTTLEVLSSLRARDIRLRMDGDSLRFDAPPGAMTDDLRAELGRHKAEIIALLRASADAADPMPKIPRGGPLPLSFAQQRLWFIDQLTPGSCAYNALRNARLRGPINASILEKSLQEIVRRHEPLRTTFSAEDGQPAQIIHADLPPSFEQVDLRALPEPERAAEIERRSDAESARPFDLARGPLVRARLLTFAPDEHLLILALHHIIFDGWSIDVIFRELGLIYEALLADRPAELPELTRQYADFAVWQRQWLQGDRLRSHLDYWKNHLGTEPPALDLPTDRPRALSTGTREERETVFLDNDFVQSLQAFAVREGVTLYMLLLAAFHAQLHRYTGSTDSRVGSPISGRTRRETEEMIGFFVNMLVMRADFSGGPTFRELLARVRQTALDAFAHQEVPFEKLVEELPGLRDADGANFFQATFNLLNFTAAQLRITGVGAEIYEPRHHEKKFDLGLDLTQTTRGLQAVWSYDPACFDAATIRRMTGHYQTLLEGALRNPDSPVASLPLLTEAERRQLLVEWNDTDAAYPDQSTYAGCFEAQVARTPGATAVSFREHSLTYAELDRRANQLAHHLQSLGVGPDQLVGVCIERSLELAIGLLAILKAGGAYLPLDPAYPKERLAHMLTDSQAPVLLTQKKFLEQLPVEKTVAVCLDDPALPAALARPGFEKSPASRATPDSLAYVIYTSGSTGKPKGVQITQRSLLNHNFSVGALFALRPSDRVLQFASLSFDIAVEEIFPSWLHGGTVVFRTDEAVASMENFCKFIGDQRITVLDLPTAFWHELVDAMAGHSLPGTVRLVVIGGEKASEERFAAWRKRLRHPVKLLNTYGPTETTVVATVLDTDTCGDGPLSIGRPIANTQIYLLNPQLQPVPAGVPGQLFIGGDGVARGYLNRPELTAEKFVPDPFSHKSGARLYATGDRARYLPGGNLEFLGRVDDQVKLRGFRIELGEIESRLRQHPAVRDTVVLVREDVPGDPQLVAYLVAAGAPPAPDELRRFLLKTLPDYMVPAVYLPLPSLPVTPNGKIDRRALPAPDRSQARDERTFVAPGSPQEIVLAEIWSQVLRLERVGIHDNFFALGGHSLKATQIVSRVSKAFQVDLPLRAIFESPTIAELATVVENLLIAQLAALDDAEAARQLQP